MKAHIGTHQRRFLIGILGAGLLSFGAGPYGSGADPIITSDPAVARLPGGAPVSSGEMDAEEGGVWEAYAGMIAAATAACFPSSLAEPETLPLLGDPINQKMRYLSFNAGDPGRLQAVRVTFVNLPSPYDTWNGVVMWVQQPTTYCESSGLKLPPCPPHLPSSEFIGGTLQCDPHFRDWSTLGVVHVFHEGIIPSATYTVQVIDSTCAVLESNFSDPLIMTTSRWGDVVRDCTTCPCGPPDGVVGLATDVTAVFDKFRHLEPPDAACAPVTKARADIEPHIPDQLVNISDCTYVLDAFRGYSYPFLPGEPPCGGPMFVCGNDILEPGEQCDDGNRIPGDGCDENCMSELCGNGAIDGGEECDDGPDNSDTEPDACRTDCTLPRCGDDVVDSGEECDDGNTSPGDGCDENCQIEPFIGDAVISLVPVSSSDPGATIVEEENMIELSSGGHQVFLNIRVSDWDPGATGLQLKAWQAVIDSTGYTSGLQGTLTPYAPTCVDDDDCAALMGPLGHPWGGARGGCGAAGWPAGECIPAWIDNARTDYISYNRVESAAVDVSTLDFRYGSTASAFSSPGIAELYAGTLAVDVPVDAAGTFVIDFRHGAGDTCLIDQDNYLIPLGGIESAVITVLTACCLPGGSCNPTMSVEDCLSAGGAIVTECAGDNDGNGIDDACESAGCCLSDGSCMELSRAECGARGGTFVCGCLGDVDPVNGVDDACEPCAVASTPLAEDGGFGTCSGDGDCPGLSVCRSKMCVGGLDDGNPCTADGECDSNVCRGICYVPKNRYISFNPNNAGRCVALRVDMTASDTFPGCTLTGDAAKWVGEPDPATGIARIEDAPVYRNWTETAIDVGDMEIVPASTYEVLAIEQGCEPNDPTKYSAPLILPTVPIPGTCADSCVAPCPWADIVGIQVPPGVYLPPDGKVDFDDIVAMIEAILEDPNAPPFTWTDLMREVPNGRIDIRDLIAIDDACRSTDPYFANYPGASPCGTGRTHQPPKAQDSPRANPVLECRLFDLDGNLLIEDTDDDVNYYYQAIPSQPVETEMFLKDVVELRAYTVALDPARNGGSVADWISCPDGVEIDVWHRVCAGTRENCLYEDDCKWWCVGGGNEWGACDPDADCDGGACIAGSCVGGGNPGAPCDPDVDCPDGLCDDGAPKICVGGDDHRSPCVDSSDCQGGQGCKACAEDFVFFASTNRFVDPYCEKPLLEIPLLEIRGQADPTDLGDTPPGYLGTYTLNIPGDVGGRTFNIEIMPDTSRSEEPEETSYFLTSLQNANDDSISFEYDVPCARLKVLYDCNLNGMPDECDIGDEITCASALCLSYTGPGRPECGQSNNCNDNGYPDECEIVSAQCPAVPDGPYYCCPDCIGCPEDPAHCVCSSTQEDCPEGCDCVTGEGCPEDCEPECVPAAVACDPDCNLNYIPDACDIANCAGAPDFCDCNNNDVPDKCDIMEDDSGFCLEGSCSWDCQPNQIPDECEADCSNDVCPDDCEWMDRSAQGQPCGQPVAEEDCDSDGMCNVDEISEANNGACTGEDCSSDCHVYCYDPEVYKPWCDPYVGIPDECDIGDCSGGDPDCSDCDGNGVPDWCDINVGCDRTCCRDCQPETDPRHGIPDGCDIRDCDGDVACQDWNYNDVPDACDIPQDELNHPGWYFCTDDPVDCPSCDANENRIPDECECPGASQSGACDNAFDGPAAPTTTIDAAFRIEWLNGNLDEFSGLSGSATIQRGTPHFHDDDPEDKGDDQPCLVPPGFPEPQPTDFTRSREVHLEITSLQVGTCPAGPCVRHRAAEESIGETQGTCLDFPADTFFTWYIQATMGTRELHNVTPIVLRSELPDFGWTFANPRSVFANDHTRPAIPLFEDNGVQRAYLATTRLGQGQFTEGTDESCRVYRGVDGRVSFAVDGQTYGVLIPNCETNHVKEDKDAVSARQRVTVYNAMGDPPPPADFTGTWENSNAMVPALTGDMEAVDDPFHVGDAINSMSFGRDGTGNTTSPILYFSVDVDSTGRECTDVSRQVLAHQDDRQRVAADVYMAAGKAFGSYDSPLVPPCTTEHGNCLVADQTALGLGPLVKGKDLAGQVDRGLKDNIIALETSTFPGDWAYFTFKGVDDPLDKTKTTIYVYNPANGSFRRGTLAPFVNLGPTEDGGLGILKSGDTVDAIAVSDVGSSRQGPNGQWDDGDEVLFSLAPGSQTLLDHGWSGAHIFKVTHGQSDPITVANVFLGPAALGLMGGTDDPDDIDGIDVGAAKTFDDCNHNGIDDLCDIARGFSANDIDPPANIPDECETACSVTSEAPEPERLPLLGDPISQKVRYISFNPTDTGQRQAIRVTFEDLPAPFNVFNGEVMWIDEPTTYCENGGVKKPPCPPAQPSDDFLGAMLQCQPYFTDWHGVCRCGWCIGGFNDGQTCSEDSDCAHTIHVYDQLIVPYGVYRIDVIDQRCTDLSNELSYSEPMVKDDLETTTSKWGDLIRDCTTCPYWPPDGVINMATDVTAVLDKFRNLEPPDVNCAPVTKARADIEPDIPDQLVNISDATCVLDAFRGFDYPFTAPDLPLCDDGASD